MPNVLVITGSAQAGTTETLIPDTATLSLSGFAPDLLLTETLVPATASLVLTGFSPTTNQIETLSPGTASLTLTGFAPDPITGIIPGTVTLVLTGYAPETVETGRLTPDVGSMTLTGFAPNLISPPSDILIPGTASMVTSRFAPTVITEQGQAYEPWYFTRTEVIPCNLDEEDQAVRIVLPASTNYIIPMVIQELINASLIRQDLSGAQAIEFSAWEVSSGDPYIEKDLADGVTRLDQTGYIEVEFIPADTESHKGSSFWQLMYTDSEGNVRQAGRGQLILT